MHHRLTRAVLAPALLTLALSGCSAEPAPVDDRAADETAVDAGGDGHGAIDGAEELAEPRLGLTSVDAAGTVTHLDLLDETTTELGRVDTPRAVHTDGRYLFVQNDSGVEIVDSGVWTWDHVDHFHYYRAQPRILGTVPGDGDVTVSTTNSSTSGGTGLYFAGSGDAVLLDTEALSRGEIRELFRVAGAPGPGLTVPVGSFALVTEGSGASRTVVGRAADGTPTGVVDSCPDAGGTRTTRVGAVIGCADGALLATATDDDVTTQRIPYPEGLSGMSVAEFDNREGRPTVAGLVGDEILLLDTRDRSWTRLPAPAPLVHVTAVDDGDDHVLALARDGRVLVLRGTDGAVLAETAPLVAASVAAGATPTLVADQQRAYLSGPVEKNLYELDFADDARIARTFDTATEPVFTAGTGR